VGAPRTRSAGYLLSTKMGDATMRHAWLFGCLLVLVDCGPAWAEGLRVGDLRCEYLCNPLGIDVAAPRLSWVLESDQRGQRQDAYQVLVASSPDLLAQEKGDLWDSGKVAC